MAFVKRRTVPVVPCEMTGSAGPIKIPRIPNRLSKIKKLF
jgi:hypothetical protein